MLVSIFKNLNFFIMGFFTLKNCYENQQPHISLDRGIYYAIVKLSFKISYRILYLIQFHCDDIGEAADDNRNLRNTASCFDPIQYGFFNGKSMRTPFAGHYFRSSLSWAVFDAIYKGDCSHSHNFYGGSRLLNIS